MIEKIIPTILRNRTCNKILYTLCLNRFKKRNYDKKIYKNIKTSSGCYNWIKDY